MTVLESRAVAYARWCLKSGNEQVGTWVKLQAEQWLEIAEGDNSEAYVDEAEFQKICKLLKLMVHPDLHCSMLDGVEDYAWLYITATLCTYWRPEQQIYADYNTTWEQQQIRYYETSVLEISRKQHKSFYSALIMLLLMLSGDRFSRYFTVSPSLDQSNEILKAARKIIRSSPVLNSEAFPSFKIIRNEIRCLRNESEYKSLAFSRDNLDSKLANAYIADEAGMLENYPVEAMRTSQIELANKLGMIISTQYPKTDSAFLSELDIAKKFLQKSEAVADLGKYFALLYEPDDHLKRGGTWMTDDRVIYQANPVAVEKISMFKSLKKQRAAAILDENKRENFLCKNCNIQYKGLGTEGYVDIQDVRLCKVAPDRDWWRGRRVWVGLDLSQSEDNTAAVMSTYDADTGIIRSKAWGFIPGDEQKVLYKTKREHVDYERMIREGYVQASESKVIDYSQVESLILGLEEEYGVTVVQVGYDPYNANSTIQKLEKAGLECVLIKQTSAVLHSATKLLKEKILTGHWQYEENPLLEDNFSNARCTEDTNLNKYVNKKRSTGKVDEVIATILSIYLIEHDDLYGDDGEDIEFFTI